MKNEALAARIALMLLSETFAGDAGAQGHIDALRARLDERSRRASTVVDEDGNITIALRPVGLAAEGSALQ